MAVMAAYDWETVVNIAGNRKQKGGARLPSSSPSSSPWIFGVFDYEDEDEDDFRPKILLLLGHFFL